MRRIALLAATALLVTACGNKNAAKSWVGQPISAVMATSGAPELESQTGDGGRALTWYERNGYGQVVCRINMVTNSSGIVIAANRNCS